MDTKHEKHMSDTYLLGVLLAVTGGFLDAYTYVARGGVFSNAQTGNIVQMGISCAQGDMKGVSHNLVSVVAFAVGVLISEFIKLNYKQAKAIHWRQIILFAEVVVLFAVAFISKDMVANILISFVCALQVQTFRKINGNTLSTTMCTGNLRSATEFLFNGIVNKNAELARKSCEYYGIIGFFAVGAVMGTVVTHIFDDLGVLCPCALLFVCFVLLFLDKNNRGFKTGN